MTQLFEGAYFAQEHFRLLLDIKLLSLSCKLVKDVPAKLKELKYIRNSASALPLRYDRLQFVIANSAFLWIYFKIVREC